MNKAILFDLDGTLVNTGDGIISSVKHMIQSMGFPVLNDDILKEFVGPPIRQKLIDIYDISDELAGEAMHIFRNHYGEYDLLKAKIYDGIEEVLLILRNRGYELAVATYKREDQASYLLEKLELSKYFSYIHGSDKEGKLTKTQIIYQAIGDLKVDKKNTILIGDTKGDVIAAAEVGIPFIGVLYGFGFKQSSDIEIYGQYESVKMPNELVNIIKKI